MSKEFNADVIYDDVVELAHSIAAKALGATGRILYPVPDNSMLNCRVVSEKLGTIWYGDLQESDYDKLKGLEKQLGHVITIQSDY